MEKIKIAKYEEEFEDILIKLDKNENKLQEMSK